MVVRFGLTFAAKASGSDKYNKSMSNPRVPTCGVWAVSFASTRDMRLRSQLHLSIAIAQVFWHLRVGGLVWLGGEMASGNMGTMEGAAAASVGEAFESGSDGRGAGAGEPRARRGRLGNVAEFQSHRAIGAGNRRGRRSALLAEAIREVAPRPPERSEEQRKAERAEILRKARAAKKPKAKSSGGGAIVAARSLAQPGGNVALYDVPRGVMDELASKASGVFDTSPLAMFLRNAPVDDDVVLDEDYSTIAQEYCRGSHTVMSSVTARAMRCMVERRRIPEALAHFASALTIFDHDAIRYIVHAMASSASLEPILFLETS